MKRGSPPPRPPRLLCPHAPPGLPSLPPSLHKHKEVGRLIEGAIGSMKMEHEEKGLRNKKKKEEMEID